MYSHSGSRERLLCAISAPACPYVVRAAKQSKNLKPFELRIGKVPNQKSLPLYLLPVDAKLDDLYKTAYPIQALYDHLSKIGARTIMLMLEANFAKNLDELIDPPNLPELEAEAMPVNPVPWLAVFEASDRDQKTIKDPEYGIGLFTRHLIEGLAGRADAAPLGNDDKRIDTVELYVYTADAVCTAARKSFGLEQSRCSARSTIWWWATSRRIDDTAPGHEDLLHRRQEIAPCSARGTQELDLFHAHRLAGKGGRRHDYFELAQGTLTERFGKGKHEVRPDASLASS